MTTVSGGSIKHYFPKVESNEHSRKLHLIHEIDQIYTEPKPKTVESEHNPRPLFYEKLEKFIKDSEVPVILTTSGSSIPAEFKDYDVIQVGHPSLQDLSRFIWTVFHLEYHLCHLYKNQMNREDQIEEKIVEYLSAANFVEILTLQQMETVLQRMDSKIDKTLTMFQQLVFSQKSVTFLGLMEEIDNNNREELATMPTETLSPSTLNKYINY